MRRLWAGNRYRGRKERESNNERTRSLERGGKTILGNSKPRFLLTEGFAKSGRKCDCLGRWLTLKKGTVRMDRGMDGWRKGKMAEALEGTQKERHENPRARGKFGGGRGTSGLVRNRRLVEPTREKNRGGGRGARITPARHATLEKDIYAIREKRKKKGKWKNISVEMVETRWRKGRLVEEEERVSAVLGERDGRKRGKKRGTRRAAFPGGGIPAPRRELRGSGARECIIKKQETSSFSPPLVKILNGDFMLPALLTCCLVLAPALVRAYIYGVSVTSGCVCVSARASRDSICKNESRRREN